MGNDCYANSPSVQACNQTNDYYASSHSVCKRAIKLSDPLDYDPTTDTIMVCYGFL
jgi:hypothetical protein